MVIETKEEIHGCGLPVSQHRVMSEMNKSGDTKIIWNPDNAEEVAAARKSFDELTKKGYLAYKVKNDKGDKGEQIRSFDPQAEAIILAPQLRGG